MEVGDFEFVRELAAKQPTFTIPPPYVLWLVLRIKDAVCLVADYSGHGPVAYLLAVPVEAPSKAIYVWQLASTDKGQRQDAVLTLLSEFREIVRSLRVQTVAFSTVPGSAALRRIRSYTEKVFSADPRLTSALPIEIGPNESLYQFEMVD